MPMKNVLELFLQMALLLFIAGSLLEMGLRVPLRHALAALGDWRFAGATVLWGFVICPALAVALTWIVPLDPSHAAGLRLLALAPGAPMLPAVAARAGGELAYAASFLVVATIGTVLLMPVAVPMLVSGFTADAWGIAQPLLTLIAAPLIAGAALQAAAPRAAGRLRPLLRPVVAVATVQVVVLVAVLFGRDFVRAVGTNAIAVQCAFLAVVTIGAYVLSPGVPDVQRRVLALGLCTRNIGAAAAPLLAGGADRRAMVMVALAVPTTVAGAALASRWLSRRDDLRREQ
jgi:BASS family bile acid:Na+ symporter